MILDPPRDDDPDRSYPPDEVTLREFYKTPEWRKLAYETKKEMGRQCQCCGARAATGVRIVSDHIRPARYYWHLRLTRTNVQVLCEECNLGKGSWDGPSDPALGARARMTEQLPEPLVPADCDCTDLDGFVLNVERLMASELVALSTHEEVAAALFLWCRAWKQKPAASLPDDERVMAAFARLPLARFRKLRGAVLHGFVKCSDGRWYHRVLAAEAIKAFEKKLEFRKRRETDAERLRKWREKRGANDGETHNETDDETRFVREVKVRDSIGKVLVPSPNGEGRLAVVATPPNGTIAKPADPWKEVYARGKEILGRESGGIITKLKKLFDNKPRKVLAKLEDAAEQREPLTWITAFLWNCRDDGRLSGEYIGGVPP